jgi:hypothetical protein
MPTITRTVRQWTATARRLDAGAALAARIRAALLAHADAHPDLPVGVVLTQAEVVALAHLAPMTARWMPATPAWLAGFDDARAIAEAADAFVRARQRRR